MKYCKICVFCLLASFLQITNASSQSYAKQFSFTIDNDLFVFQKTDRYYTNGFFFNFSHTGRKRNDATIKKVVQYEIAQKMFMQYFRSATRLRQIDRPVTGYLYGKYGHSYFFDKQHLFQWDASIATIGSAAFGKEVQLFFHKLMNIKTEKSGWVWNSQLNSDFGANLHLRYAKGLLKGENERLRFQITPITQATAGTMLMNASQSLLLQVGNFNKMHQNAYFNGSVENKDNFIDRKEFYVYYNPEIQYHWYNATVQGGLFLKYKGPIVKDIEPFVMLHQVGASYSFRRYTLRTEVTFQSREVKNQFNTHQYGSILFAYRFN